MVSDIEALCWYAKHNQNIWNLTAGCCIVHRDKQYGEFIIEKTEGSSYIIISSVDHGKKTYALDNIFKYFDQIIIPEKNEELKKIISNAKNDKDKEDENILIDKNKEKIEKILIELRNKYNTPKYKDTKLMVKIDNLINKIDNKIILDKEEEMILFKNHLFLALAKYHEGLFDMGPAFQWSIAKAGKYWRYAQNPKRSLELTDIIIKKKNNNNKLISAIQTNRGAALLDLGLHDESIKCANKAIEIDDKGCCPYNLLGSIYLDIGDLDKAAEYFSIAKNKNGFDEQWQANEIRDIIKKVRARNDHKVEKLITQRFKKILSNPEKIMLEYDDIPF